MAGVEAGAKRLAQVVLGASHLVQAAVPSLLNLENEAIVAWKKELKETLEDQAMFLCDQLSCCRGLTVVEPSGAMYCLVRISSLKFKFQSDVEFASMLLKEENVFVLPGMAFGAPGYFRVVFCLPNGILGEAANRIQSFCERHFEQ